MGYELRCPKHPAFKAARGGSNICDICDYLYVLKSQWEERLAKC